MKYEIRPESGISDYYFCERVNTTHYPPHIHSHIEFVYVLDGHLPLNAYGQNLVLNKNQFCIIMPYEIHSYKTEIPSDIFILACPPEYIPEYKQIFSGKTYEPIYSDINNAYREIIDQITANNFKDDLKKKSLIYFTLADIISHCTFTEKASFEYDLYRKAINYISENYTDEKLSLQSTAAHMGVSSSHLSRVLNSDGKPGFTGLVNSLRSYSAKQMLEQQNISMAQIAFETGFGSIRNFNRIFKKIYGYTPREIKTN